MRIVAITGAGGFVGAYLCRHLISQGKKVIAIDNFVRGLARRLPPSDNLQLHEADVRDEKALTKAFEGCDSVIHLAAVNGTENFYNHPDLVLDVGINGMFSVMNAAITANVKNMIVASSAEVYQSPSIIPTPEEVELVLPNSTNPRYSYGGSKIATELIALNVGRNHFEKLQIFRPHNVYGPDMGWKHVIPQFISRISKQIEAMTDTGPIKLEIQGDGTETRAFCFVDDIVEGILLMARYGKHREIYHIGNDFEIDILGMVDIISTSMGVKIEVIPGDPAEGGTARRCPDISKMRNLGYEPKVNLQDGLKSTLNWYLDNPENVSTNDLL